MMLTVTRNPVFDALVFVEPLQLYAKNIVRAKHTFTAGKGLNVSKALSALGIETTAVGFVGRGDLEVYRRTLESRGIQLAVTAVAATRMNLKFIESDTSRETKTNEVGVPVTEAELVEFRQSFREHLPGAEWVVMSGSVAPNVPVTIYGELIREIAGRGVRSLLDTSGELLRTAVAECAFALRLNRAELSQLVASELNSIGALVDAAQSFLSYGSEVVVVSLGAKGALLVHRSRRWLAQPPPLRAVNAVGAGDVMTAGVIDGWRRGLALPDIWRWATALASASVLALESGAVDFQTARELEK